MAKTSDEIRAAFARIKTDPTAGAISGSRTIQGVEQALSKLPISTDIIGKQYAKTIDQMDEFVKKTALKLSEKEGAEQIGRQMQKGVTDFTRRFKIQGGMLYDDLWQVMPETTRVPIDEI